MDILYGLLHRLDEWKWWVLHRTVDKYHVVKCDGLAPGYHEVEDRMFAAAFGLLKDYVAVELANMHCIVSDEKLPFLLRCPGLHHCFELRSRSYGLRQLSWSQIPGHSYKEGVAKEIEALYLWYMDEFKPRLDPIDESGYMAQYQRIIAGERVCEEERSATLQRYDDLEQQYMKTDTEMLVRLVQVRRSMWS
jgi:hypothetical protein